MTEERDDIIVLVDENGEEEEFEYLDTIEMNDKEYVVLIPAVEAQKEEGQDGQDDDEDEVVILRLEHTSEEEDSFVSVEDENELNLVFEELKSRMEGEYDFS